MVFESILKQIILQLKQTDVQFVDLSFIQKKKCIGINIVVSSTNFSI